MASDVRRELEALTVKELRQRAKEWSVPLTGKRLKAEIIEAIVSAFLPMNDEASSGKEEDATKPRADPYFERLEALWIRTQEEMAAGDLRATIALAQESRRLDEWVAKYKGEMCSRALHAAELFERRYEDKGPARELKRKVREAREAYEEGDLDRCTNLIGGLEATVDSIQTEELSRIQDTLVEKERTLEELSVINVDLSKAHELLSTAEAAFRAGDAAEALRLVHGFEGAVGEALKDMKEKISGYLRTIEDKLVETEALGTTLKESRDLLTKAKGSLRSGDLVRARDLAQKCEKSVFDVQKKHIKKALELRRKHYEEVKELLAYFKPVLEEARNYGIDTESAKAHIKDALGHLGQEEYFRAMEKGREARRLLEALQPIIVVERQKRGIVKPEDGECNRCGSGNVRFWDDGWMECQKCGTRSPWATRQEPRFMGFLKKRLAK